jgi:hypothetical protein
MSNGDIVISRNLPMTLRDGTVLRGDLYRPVEGAHPTLLMRTPYSKDAPMGLMVVLHPVRAAQAEGDPFCGPVAMRLGVCGSRSTVEHRLASSIRFLSGVGPHSSHAHRRVRVARIQLASSLAGGRQKMTS